VLTGSKAPVVDALTFYNAGYFEVDTAFTSADSLGVIALPYTTQDTLHYINTSSGTMTGSPGFRFDTTTASGRSWASSFLNQGTVAGVDEPAIPVSFTVPGGTASTMVPEDGQPLAGRVLVYSTNIVNQRTLEVGNCGLLRLFGQNVTNAHGATLLAGAVDTGSDFPDPLDTTGGRPAFLAGPGYAVDAASTYDLFWGVANGATLKLDDLAGSLPDTEGDSTLTATFRDGATENGFGLPVSINLNSNLNGNLNGTVYAGYFLSYSNGSTTNLYYNMVCINTNLLSTYHITATVGFGDVEPDITNFGTANYDGNAEGVIVQFAEPVFDVITGETVTNAVYLLDTGAYLVGGMTLFENAGSPDGYMRPVPIEITTTTPDEWFGITPGAFLSFPVEEMGTNIYTDQQFAAKDVGANIATYGAQIGRSPQNLDGSFFGGGLFGLSYITNLPPTIAGETTVLLPDPSNEPGRIEINADNLDLTQARIRAEGMVLLHVTNLVGGGTGVADFGQADASIGTANGTLVLSNIFPTTFRRVRGNIYAWEANWVNVQTNNGPFYVTNSPATNVIHYHLLVVDQNLQGSFLSTLRNLSLRGKDSITVQDNLYVINRCLFDTPTLVFKGTNTFTQNAQDLTPANMPNLKNLVVGSNAVLEADSSLVVGFNLGQAQGGPAGRTYTVNSIRNFGLMESTAPLLEAASIENDGSVVTDYGGSIVIEANTLGLGLAVSNNPNYLSAGGNVNLSANVIRATNSYISAGTPGYEAGALTLYAPVELTDGVSRTPTTNTNSVIVNFWTVNGGGFSMPVKPVTGDLFGTEIITSVSNFQQAVHVWAGEDRGAKNGGFVNNAVIGRLVLDRQSKKSVLHFSAAGAQNAMYVDYLQLTNYAYSDYREGLEIDDNFTIYFADCNGDPEKLMEVYPRLKWVQTFAGPNSTQVVPYLNSSNVCLINAALADSFEISFWNSLPNYYNQPYVLNDPSDPTNFIPCSEAKQLSLLVATRSSGGGSGGLVLNLVTVSVNGEGAISPVLEESQMALGKTYSLTATPSAGWVFDGWTTSGVGNKGNTQSPTLTFAFVTNTVITANFIPSPFTGLKGVYNGLFYQTNGIDPGSSGAFTLALARSGTFSGRLLMGSNAYVFNAQFSPGGAAQVEAKNGAKSLALNLQLDISGQSGRIYGDVNGGAWDAPLAGDLAPAWTAQKPSPLAGRYTMALPWETGTLNTPGGDSWAVVTVNDMGILTTRGVLADGAAFSASAPVSKDGQWPFYAYSAAGKDTVLGWVSVGADGLAGSNVGWSKAGGFTNVLQLVGSPWQGPAATTPALNLANSVLLLAGGNLPEELAEAVTLRQSLSYGATNVSLSINPAAGNFSGWFVNPGTGGKLTMSGVVLQNQDSARGFFAGTNGSGAVLLENQ